MRNSGLRFSTSNSEEKIKNRFVRKKKKRKRKTNLDRFNHQIFFYFVNHLDYTRREEIKVRAYTGCEESTPRPSQGTQQSFAKGKNVNSSLT